MAISTRNMVDPELLEILDTFGEIGFHSNPVSAVSLAHYRQTMADIADNAPAPDDSGVICSQVAVPGTVDSNFGRALIYSPARAAGDLPAVMYIHGGGFVFGSPESAAERCFRMARELGVIVVAPAYRLAPENPFPAGINDCLSCLRFIHRSAKTLGVDRNRIAISGDSAGGGIAASVAQRSRFEWDMAISFQALIYPMLDDRTAGDLAEDSPLGEFVWTAESNKFAWDSYLSELAPAEYCRAVPARCDELDGLPPTWIGTAGLDLFLDENISYARSLIEAGVSTELTIYPGTFHAFIVDQSATITQKFESDYLSALRRGLGLKIN